MTQFRSMWFPFECSCGAARLFHRKLAWDSFRWSCVLCGKSYEPFDSRSRSLSADNWRKRIFNSTKNEWRNVMDQFVVLHVLLALIGSKGYFPLYTIKGHTWLSFGTKKRKWSTNQWCRCLGSSIQNNIETSTRISRMRPPIALFFNDFPARLHFTRENERIQFQNVWTTEPTQCMRLCAVQIKRSRSDRLTWNEWCARERESGRGRSHVNIESELCKWFGKRFLRIILLFFLLFQFPRFPLTSHSALQVAGPEQTHRIVCVRSSFVCNARIN